MFQTLKIRKVSSLFIWLMFVNLFVVNLNQAMFVHTHHLPDGTTVVHAHPFDTEKENDDRANQHQHTKIEYVLLDNFNHFVNYHAGIQFQQSPEIVINYNIASDWVSPEPPIYHPSLRAPPLWA
jgi:hypothetical protein